MKHGHKYSEDDILELLKEKKLSITGPRKLILKLLTAEHGPYTADEIFQKLPKGSCDKASVYRSLSQFVDKDIVQIAHLEKDVVHYEFNHPDDHHHHIVCRLCHKVEVIHDCGIERLERTLEKNGYTNVKHRLEMVGTCDKCNFNKISRNG